MKKTYIAPALKNHMIAIESAMLAGSNGAYWGNDPETTPPTEESYDDYNEMEDVDGDDWYTL